jgi:hypothetical protein
MTRRRKQNLSLDQRVTYQIVIPGVIDTSWSDWDVAIRVEDDYNDEGLSMSILTGSLDQAALQGLLRHLYSLGIPLISVNLVDVE